MHDRHGNPLALGDSVVIRGTISSMQAPDNEHCNLTVLVDVPMAGSPYYVTLNAKQTEFVNYDPGLLSEEPNGPAEPYTL